MDFSYAWFIINNLPCCAILLRAVLLPLALFGAFDQRPYGDTAGEGNYRKSKRSLLLKMTFQFIDQPFLRFITR